MSYWKVVGLSVFISITIAISTSYATVVKPSQVAMEYQTRIEYDGSGNATYIAKSLEPCLESEACWQIKQITYNGSDPEYILWANGNHAFDFIWDSRAGYTYSST